MANDTELLQPAADPMFLDPRIALQLEQGVNQGVIAPTDDELQTLAGAVLDMSQFPVFAPDSDWDRFLSDFDSQIGRFFDTFGCNIFSSVGGAEMYLNALGGDADYNNPVTGKIELSERKVCVDAGLDGLHGSSEAQWENAINTTGDVKWADFPWDPQTTTVEQFFAKPTPSGAPFLAKYQPFHRNIGTDHASIIEALKYGPVKIFIATGHDWNNGEPYVIQKNNNPMGHAVLVRRIDAQGVHIRDQYFPYLKCLAPDYIIYFAFQTLFKKKGQAMAKHYILKDGAQLGVLVVQGFVGALSNADNEAHLQEIRDALHTPADAPTVELPSVPEV